MFMQSGGGGLHEHAPVGLLPVQLSCAGHAVVLATKKQPLLSAAQLDCELLVAQNVSVADAQLGSVLHVQTAEPATPVQLWRWPQATSAPVAKKQPWASCAQLVRPLALEQTSP